MVDEIIVYFAIERAIFEIIAEYSDWWSVEVRKTTLIPKFESHDLDSESAVSLGSLTMANLNSSLLHL